MQVETAAGCEAQLKEIENKESVVRDSREWNKQEIMLLCPHCKEQKSIKFGDPRKVAQDELRVLQLR